MNTERPLRTPPIRRGFARVFVAFLFAFLVYVLSAGPAWWLVSRGALSTSTYWRIYEPIAFLDSSPGDIFYKYINWWASVIKVNNSQITPNERK
jgi:hypothetical protein